jgi:flavin reductase (DIM6/NTAB) family NADH-FMN oxidoreductase RutF
MVHPPPTSNSLANLAREVPFRASGLTLPEAMFCALRFCGAHYARIVSLTNFYSRSELATRACVGAACSRSDTVGELSTRKGVTEVEAGVDLDVANWALRGMWEFPIAITTRHEGQCNGLISSFTSNASTVPEAPRVLITLSQYNLTHDLVSASGVFAVHLLAVAPDSVLERSLEMIRVLAGNSGRDMDKLTGFETTDGVTGCPILADALCYVEGRVIGKLETEENTIFLGDVVAAGRLRNDERL